MSRRTFLENMRQAGRHRDDYDSEGRSSSTADHADAHRPTEAWRQHESDTASTRDSPEVHSTGAPLAPAGAHADPPSPARSSPLATPELQRHAYRNGSGSATSTSAHAAAHAESPWGATSPPQASLSAAYGRAAHTVHVGRDLLNREVATSISSGASSARHPLSDPRTSSDAAFRGPSVEEQPLSSDGASTTAAGSASGRRASVGDGRGRRSSRSSSALGDAGARRESSSGATQRLAQAWGSVGQSRKSLSGSTLSVGRRPSAPASASASASASRQDRSGSINRMEASMVALQVELATEKRNNIEAEHHITTLNREVERLRQENAQLSREVARADATRGASAPPDSASAAPEGATTAAHPKDADAAAAATRIELLEARLSELLRNMETRQRELDTKDERIRLLEHKLADQLLLYSGMSYMGMIPGGGGVAQQPLPYMYQRYPQQPQPQQQQQTPPQARFVAQTVHTSTHNLSDASSFESPARPTRHGEELNTTPTPGATPAGRKTSAVRSVSAHSVHVSHGGSPGSRPSSTARSRNAYSMLNRSDFTEVSEAPVPTVVVPAKTTSTTTTSAHGAPSAPASTSPPGEQRAPSATRELRRSTPRRPSVRRGTTPLRTSGVASASTNGVGAKGLTPWSRVAADPHGARSNPGSRKASIANPAQEVHDTAPHTSRKPQPQTSAAAHSGSEGGPRRPSVQHRPSATIEQSRPSTSSLQRRPSTSSLQRRASTTSFQRRSSTATVPGDGRTAAAPTSSRRSSGGSPLQRQPSSASTGGHPMRLVDTRAASPTGSGYLNVPPSSTFLVRSPSGRRSSATRSIAQQSVRSGTSTRSRPQITYSADTDTTTMKGTTTTVVFRSNNHSNMSHGTGSYARDGAPLLPTRSAASPAATAPADAAAEGVLEGEAASIQA